MLSYGALPDQAGDLYLPDAIGAPLVCLFHGGFWRLPYGREELAPVAEDLCSRGLAVWNLEYRRTGAGGYGWPATFEDIDRILGYLPSLHQAYPQVDIGRVVMVGHSAGGHLAFWAASRRGDHPPGVSFRAVIGLAPILDLHAAHADGLGRGAVEALLGGSAAAVPDRYRQASPRALLPLGIRQYLIHGEADDAVPPGLSKAFVEAARSAGDHATCHLLPDTDHMAFLDPRSRAHSTLCQCLAEATEAGT
jgi:acetyl esterase/lipase